MLRDLEGALPVAPGVPLRVAAYIRISDAIRRGTLGPSSLLPSEADLVRAMGVSRTVVREALILLEEDGLIQSRRGVGRVVAPQLPPTGLETVQPYETLLGEAGAVEARRTARVQAQKTASFAADVLGLSEDDPTWVVETLLSRATSPVALVHEHLKVGGELAQTLDKVQEDETVLAALMRTGHRTSGGTTTVTVGTAGATRAKLLAVPPSTPILVLTRILHFGDSESYVSKAMIKQNETQLIVYHSAS